MLKILSSYCKEENLLELRPFDELLAFCYQPSLETIPVNNPVILHNRANVPIEVINDFDSFVDTLFERYEDPNLLN